MTGALLERVRSEKPLVHHITNWVTIYDCASMTRAFGALPVMAHAAEEAADMARLASSLVLNIGTLTPALVEAMIIAGRSANDKGVPVVLDAVGVGATPLRDDAAFKLLDRVRIAVIKGNASEIARLAGHKTVTKGVETTDVAGDHAAIARTLASSRKAVAVITGAVDIVAGQGTVYAVRNGSPMMGAIVGTGCMAASVIGAFAAVEKDYARASAAALACYGIAGSIAAEGAKGPGSFKAAFYDAVWNLDAGTVERMADIAELTA